MPVPVVSWPVPARAAIAPNIPVSIITKQDQPTGRQVVGRVAQILTKGDHPSGVKVRLVDGRVGRVQRVLTVTSLALQRPPEVVNPAHIVSGPASQVTFNAPEVSHSFNRQFDVLVSNSSRSTARGRGGRANLSRASLRRAGEPRKWK
ncbi:hypothetical protein ABW21_db0200961 [Orbilia brochopaga]|nr:hypothetical protein ABW21_db0200961 [Drechslerella brochopaga]